MKIKVNNVELFYEKYGIGAPLILLHGNGEDHHIFDKLSAKLKDHFTIYSIDSRNHGASMKTGHYSYEAMSQDIYFFIQSLNLKSANIIGFSDGAIISLTLAMAHSEVVTKMALLGVNLSPSDFTQESYQFVKDTYEQTNDPLFKLMLEQPNIKLEDVKNVLIPTLVVAADEDIFKPETFVQLSKALRNSQLIIMQGHQHDSYITNNDILYNDVLRFFELRK